jgi:hypothetical protein
VFSGAPEPEPSNECPFGRAPGEAGVEAAGEALPKRPKAWHDEQIASLQWQQLRPRLVPISRVT